MLPHRITSFSYPNFSGSDDFRTALQSATEHLKTLESLCQQVPETQNTLPSSGDLQTVHIVGLNQQLVEALSQLTEVLRRNLRVRYELPISDILKVLVKHIIVYSPNIYVTQCHALSRRFSLQALSSCSISITPPRSC
jgi:hypothetical protein